jgi:hypothetical protein
MFIIIEYCSKGSMSTIMNGNLTIEDEEWRNMVKNYFKQMAAALAFSIFYYNKCIKII